MLNLLNEKVSHKSLGEGTIVEVEDEVITVQFAKKTSKFTFPAAFEKYLTAQNPAIASMIQGMIGDIKAAEAKAKKKQKARIEQRLAETSIEDSEDYQLVIKGSTSRLYPQLRWRLGSRVDLYYS